MSIYINGMTYRLPGSTAASMTFNPGSAGSPLVLENCTFELVNTHSLSTIIFGPVSSGIPSRVKCIGCNFVFGNSGQHVVLRSVDLELINCVFNVGVGATILSEAFSCLYYNSSLKIVGCDLNDMTTLVDSSVSTALLNVEIIQSKLRSGFILNDAGAVDDLFTVLILDCDSGDVHYRIGHADFLGELQVDTGIYCNDNITDANLSWKIVSSANASFTIPYKTPWITIYNRSTSAITPYLEILRSGSSTAFTDAEVWAEWSYKGTSGSTLATVDHDRCVLLETPVAQTSSSKTATDWTGENATSWFGKIGLASSVTTVEEGDLCFRICVGVASTTVYVDPQIRGLF